MSRQRKVVDMQNAHLTQKDRQKKKQEEREIVTGNEDLEKPPAWLLNADAKKEWKRVTEELKKIEIVGNLDYVNLACYCNAYANYVKVTRQLKKASYCIERETRTGTIIVKNPLIDIQTNYATEMRKFAGLCGLTIDSRLKAAVKKVDKKEEKLEKKFGAI